MQIDVLIVIIISTHVVFLKVCCMLKFSIQSLNISRKLQTDFNPTSSLLSKTNYKEPLTMKSGVLSTLSLKKVSLSVCGMQVLAEHSPP